MLHQMCTGKGVSHITRLDAVPYLQLQHTAATTAPLQASDI